MKEKNGEHPFGDTGQLICLIAFLVVWVGDSFVFRWTTFLSEYVLLWVRLVVAVVLGVGAVALTRLGHIVVHSDARYSDVIDWGAFRYVRHPLYLGTVLFYLALAVATASLISLLVFLAVFVFYNYIAGYEERLMVSKFGDVYTEYQRTTGRWVPRFGSRKQPINDG